MSMEVRKVSRYQIMNAHWFLLLVVVAALSLVTGAINDKFLTLRNIVSILEQISVLGLVASGATILIISGNFDISVGSMIGLSACIMAMMMARGFNSVSAALTGIIICILCASLNGLLSILLRAPSFIISLASIGIFHGTALAITEGVIQTIYGKFETISATRIFGFLPLLFVMSIGGYTFVHVILKYTKVGRRIFAIGSNPRAAFLAGIQVDSNRLLFFALNGLLVGVAAVMLLSRLGAALPSTGAGMELQAIGAVVIGGVPITGGKGNVVGTFFGVLLMGVISNMLNMLRVNPYLQEIAFGSLIVLSIAVSSLRVRRTNMGR